MKDPDLKKLIRSEELEVEKLHELVMRSIDEEKNISAKLLELENTENPTLGQRMADRIAEFGGSWTFILCFLGFMALWIGVNVFLLFGKIFDPYPFILLNLILSCLAALQAPIIMMSQNRQEEKDRSRARGDLMVNIKAEMEIRKITDMLSKIEEKLGRDT